MVQMQEIDEELQEDLSDKLWQRPDGKHES